MIHKPVLVVGGGISGLSCAYSLGRAGVDFLLLEQQDRLGGTIRTERVGEFLLDTGPDAFLTEKPEAVNLCKELGLESRLIPTNPGERNVFVLRRGRLYPLPEGMVLTVPTRILPFARSGLFSPWGKLRMGMEVVVPARRGGEEESIAGFVRRRLGGEALERLAEPLLAGIHSGDPERLSMDELFPRFVAMERKYGSLIRGMRKMRRPRASSSPRTVFVSLAGGLSELVEALQARLPPESVRPGAGVIRIAREKTCYAVETTSAECFSSDALVLSLPPRYLAPLCRSLSPELAAAMSGHRSVSTAVVFLAFRRDEVSHPLNGYGFVVPATEGRHILAGTFVSTKFPNRSPRTHVLLRAFLGGARDAAVLERSDAQLADLARAEVSEILGPLPPPRLARVYRWVQATPQVELGHGARLAAMERALAGFPGLEMTGNGLRGTGIPDCISEGRRAAESVVCFLEDNTAPASGGTTSA